MDAKKIAETMKTMRPDRGNRYAPHGVRVKGQAQYDWWEQTVQALAWDAENAGEMTRAEFHAACGIG